MNILIEVNVKNHLFVNCVHAGIISGDIYDRSLVTPMKEKSSISY